MINHNLKTEKKNKSDTQNWKTATQLNGHTIEIDTMFLISLNRMIGVIQ